MLKLRPRDLKMMEETQELEEYGTIPLWYIKQENGVPKGLGCECQKCGHSWIPENVVVQTCPRCKTYFWNGNWPKIVKHIDIPKVGEKREEGVRVDFLKNRGSNMATFVKKCSKCGEEVYVGQVIDGRFYCTDCSYPILKKMERQLILPRDLREVDEVTVESVESLPSPPLPKILEKENKIKDEDLIRKKNGTCGECGRTEQELRYDEIEEKWYCPKCWDATQSFRDGKRPTREEREKKLKEEWGGVKSTFIPNFGETKYPFTGTCGNCDGVIVNDAVQVSGESVATCADCAGYFSLHGVLPTKELMIKIRENWEAIRHPASTTSTPDNQSNPL